MAPYIVNRCDWSDSSDQYREYHDKEWGVPVHDDKVLFEFLILEGAQAGLNWSTILQKREGYRRVFKDFDVRKVAAMSEEDVARALENPEIVRNKLKVRSAVKNANVFLEIQNEHGSFSAYLWSFLDEKQIVGHWDSIEEVPVTTKESDALSKDLKKRGMSFVGSTIMYAYMQAVGLANDHITSCFRYNEIK